MNYKSQLFKCLLLRYEQYIDKAKIKSVYRNAESV